MKFIFILSLLLSPVLWGQTSYVSPTTILQKKGYQFGVTGDYFSTSKRMDKDGNEIKFLSGEEFHRIREEFTGLYGLTENLQISGGLRHVQNTSVRVDTTTLDKVEENSSGIESTFVGLTYAFKPVNRLQYTLEGMFRYRPYSNEESDGVNLGKLVLGDQGNELSAGLGLGYSSRTNNFLSGRVGVRRPGSELSSEVYWQVEGALVWKYIALVAGVHGISTMNNDPNEDDPLNKPNYHTGSTALYNSTNRSSVTPYGGINLALGNLWRVELQGSQVVSGQSTDLGTGFSVALIRRVDVKTKTLDSKFKNYDFEGTITKVSAKKGYVIIDKGLSDDVLKGTKIDFFEYDYVGGNTLIAQGIVHTPKSDSAIVKIIQVFNTKKVLKPGIIARGTFR